MTLRLRPYQAEAVEKFFEALPTYRRQLISLPTGSGKTVLFSAVARRYHESVDPNKPILIMAHRSELLDQAQAKLEMIWPGVLCGRVQAERNEQLGQVIIASTQTLVSGRQIPRPSLIIYDESHHSRSAGSMRLLEEIGVFKDDGPVLLGVTATPSRADKLELGDVFQHLTFERTVLQMIMDGYLTDVRGTKVTIPNLELRNMRITSGDYNTKDLSIVLNREMSLNTTVEAVLKHAKDRKKIVVFAVDVNHVNALAERFKHAGYRAAAIDGSMSTKERSSILSQFANKDLSILVNVMVLTEGFDDSEIDCVVIARPTRSSSLYTQMVGRALRLHPSKQDALVLDLTGASDDKNLQTFARLMTTQTINKHEDESERQPKSKKTPMPSNDVDTSMLPDESVTEWLKRLKEQEIAENLAPEQFVQSINLFANRSRFRWVQVKNNFSISYGDGQWAYLIVEDRSWWPVLELPQNKYLPVHDKPLPLEYAQGIVEGFLELLESKVIDGNADWRTAPMSQRQKHLLYKYWVKYDKSWTRGMASDVLNQKFAKSQVKKVLASFDPERWRVALAKPNLRQKHERLVEKILNSAQNHHSQIAQ